MEGSGSLSRHVKERFETGAAKFGWSERDPAVGSMKRDGLTTAAVYYETGIRVRELPVTIERLLS